MYTYIYYYMLLGDGSSSAIGDEVWRGERSDGIVLCRGEDKFRCERVVAAWDGEKLYVEL